MNKLNDFKNIADEIMSDISASDDLKRRTLAQCRKKKHHSFGKVLIPAACLLLTFGVLNLSGIFPLKDNPAKEDNAEINILMESAPDLAKDTQPMTEDTESVTKDTESMTDDTTSSLLQDNGNIQTWILSTTEEAGKSFGNSFLSPEYLPDEFQLDQIQASGTSQRNADRITMTYFEGDRSLYIIEEKTVSQDIDPEAKKISIRGATGYITSLQENDKTDSIYTVLYWFKDSVRYNISGQITEKEAVIIAEKMSQQ